MSALRAEREDEIGETEEDMMVKGEESSMVMYLVQQVLKQWYG